MRVVFLNPIGHLGGAERVLLDVLASVRSVEPDWSLHLVLGSEGPLAAEAQKLGVITEILPYPPELAQLGDAGAGGPATGQLTRLSLMYRLALAALPTARYVRQLRNFLRKLQPDIVHTNGYKMHMLATWAKPKKTPMIWHIHDYVRSRPVMARLLNRYAQRCSAAIANSRSVAADLRTVVGDGLRIYPVPNAVDLDKFSPDGSTLDLDSLSGLPPAAPDTLRIGMIATFARWKGHDVFLKALALLPESLRVRGYVIGGPLYQTTGSQVGFEELQSMAAQLGLRQRIGFTGYISSCAAAIRSLDIIIHASTQPEPFGMVILEGMACARPVIVSEAGGAAGISAMAGTGLGYPPGDSIQLAACLERLITSRELRGKCGEIGRAVAEQHFNYSRFSSELTAVYRETIGGLC